MKPPSCEGSEETIKRLLAVARKEVEAARGKGFQDGLAWARDTASPRELMSIERSFDAEAGKWGLPIYWVARLLDPDGERGLTCNDMSEPFYSSRPDQMEYVRGFLSGALEAWKEVADGVVMPF